MAVPSEFKYSKDHEWVKIENNVATIGITEYAQNELGDIVFVELPETEDELNADQIRTALSVHEEIVHVSIEINSIHPVYVPRETPLSML